MLQFKGARMRLSFADMTSTETPAMRARGRETLFFSETIYSPTAFASWTNKKSKSDSRRT